MKKKQKQNQMFVWVIGAAVAALIAFGLFAAFTKPAPTILMGDAWDYALSAADLGTSWSENDQNFQTLYKMTQPINLPNEPTSVPSPIQPGIQSSYYVDMSDTTSREAFVMTSQVVMYDSVLSAQTALNMELPGDEWEKVNAPQAVGDATLLWHLRPIPEASAEQATYRVDFRYLNAIHSLAVTGRKEPSADGKLAFSFAKIALEKMQKNVMPEALKILNEAQRTDLRAMLLTQRELSALDAKFGTRWIFDDRALPMWTPNSMFVDSKSLDAFGRVMGYQAMMIKAIAPEEASPTISAGLFQQVTAYREAGNAQKILDKMEGLNSGSWAKPPEVGDSARGWSTITKIEGETSRLAAVTEISFRVGVYVASVRIQTMPILESQGFMVSEANKEIAQKFALSFAGKLKGK
ncbi:MAG: hypothetical protein HZB52_12245 [Chloroflexi bacterium]|nr:hypothetical protein [Chloroflexota bacterium]